MQTPYEHLTIKHVEILIADLNDLFYLDMLWSSHPINFFPMTSPYSFFLFEERIFHIFKTVKLTLYHLLSQLLVFTRNLYLLRSRSHKRCNRNILQRKNRRRSMYRRNRWLIHISICLYSTRTKKQGHVKPKLRRCGS